MPILISGCYILENFWFINSNPHGCTDICNNEAAGMHRSSNYVKLLLFSFFLCSILGTNVAGCPY